MTLQDKATIVNDDIKTSFGGDTPLVDITTNQSDPLVNLVTTLLAGQTTVDEAIIFLQSGLYASDVGGSDLTLVAQLSGTDRQIDQPSKAPIIVMGQAGAVLPAGSILTDRQGAEWTTTLPAVIQDCYGYTNACSPVGRFDLRNGELKLRDSFNNIDKATNAAAPSLGGTFETDEHLRNRLTGKRPQWQNKGTEAALLWALEQLTGVFKAKVITDLPDCHNITCVDPVLTIKNYMVAVLGGVDLEIAETIYENLCFGADRLIGDTVVPIRCDEVQFQPMCAVKVEVRYWLRCDCQSPEGANDLDQLIADRLNENSLNQDYWSSTDLCKVSKDLLKAEFRLIPKPIGPDCADCDIFDNPITGEVGEEYCTSDLNTKCFTGTCGGGDWSDCVTLQPWWYPVFLPTLVTAQTGCPCPTPSDACGCAA